MAAGNVETRANDGAEPDSVVFMLDWTPNVNHVGIFVAQAGGFFERENLQVDIAQPGEVYAPAAIVGGKADFGVDYQENLTLLRADDVPLVSIATILQTNTSGFAAPSHIKAETPADFSSLRYATFYSQFELPTLRALIRCAEGESVDPEFVPAGTDILAMFAAERADLAWIFYGTQGIQAQNLGIDIDYFPMSDYFDCIPDYYTPIIITHNDTIMQRPNLIRRFMSALSDAHQFVVDNPRQAAEMLYQQAQELNRDELVESVAWLKKHMISRDRGWGWQEESIWQGYTDWMRHNGLVDGSVDIDSAFTNQYLPAYDNGQR